MSEETKKIEKIDKTEQDPKIQETELSEQNLDEVAGGSSYSTSRSNIRGSK